MSPAHVYETVLILIFKGIYDPSDTYPNIQ
jgi:hypothetical protein